VGSALLLSCEHGGNRVPSAWKALFRGAGSVLATHRGYDPGALPLARALARRTGAPLFAVTVTRLLVDPNRSPRHPDVFSEFTRPLPREARRRLLARHHRPHRERVATAVAQRRAARLRVVHVAVHSFTPIWQGVPRRTDVGILYDPRREGERRFAARLRQEICRRAPGLTVHRNQPYRGRADGLPTALRRDHPASRYLGIELEVSQRLLAGGASGCRSLPRILAESLFAAQEGRRGARYPAARRSAGRTRGDA
jgi:predicted N-formylglutamate amidohydrolase